MWQTISLAGHLSRLCGGAFPHLPQCCDGDGGFEVQDGFLRLFAPAKAAVQLIDVDLFSDNFLLRLHGLALSGSCHGRFQS